MKSRSWCCWCCCCFLRALCLPPPSPSSPVPDLASRGCTIAADTPLSVLGAERRTEINRWLFWAVLNVKPLPSSHAAAGCFGVWRELRGWIVTLVLPKDLTTPFPFSALCRISCSCGKRHFFCLWLLGKALGGDRETRGKEETLVSLLHAGIPQVPQAATFPQPCWHMAAVCSAQRIVNSAEVPVSQEGGRASGDASADMAM